MAERHSLTFSGCCCRALAAFWTDFSLRPPPVALLELLLLLLMLPDGTRSELTASRIKSGAMSAGTDARICRWDRWLSSSIDRVAGWLGRSARDCFRVGAAASTRKTRGGMKTTDEKSDGCNCRFPAQEAHWVVEIPPKEEGSPAPGARVASARSVSVNPAFAAARWPALRSARTHQQSAMLTRWRGRCSGQLLSLVVVPIRE